MRFAGSLQADDLQVRPHSLLVGQADPTRFLGSMLGSRGRRPVGSAGAGPRTGRGSRGSLVSGAELRVRVWVPCLPCSIRSDPWKAPAGNDGWRLLLVLVMYIMTIMSAQKKKKETREEWTTSTDKNKNIVNRTQDSAAVETWPSSAR